RGRLLWRAYPARIPQEAPMASTVDMVQQHLGDNGVDQLTQHLGVDQGTAQAAIAAALPMLVNAAQTQMAQSAGSPSLPRLVGAARWQAVQQVSKQSGLDLHQGEKALLFLAPLVLAKLMNQPQPATAGAAAAPGPVGQPAAPQVPDGQSSGLSGVLGAVEKMFHPGT